MRKDNPTTGTIAAVAIAVTALAAGGWWLYVSKKSSTSEAEKKLAPLPAFDQNSTDKTRFYVVQVYTTKPVPTVQAEQSVDQPVAVFLRSLSDLDHIVVKGPGTEEDMQKIFASADPSAEMFIAVDMTGKVVDGATRKQIEALKQMVAQGL